MGFEHSFNVGAVWRFQWTTRRFTRAVVHFFLLLLLVLSVSDYVTQVRVVQVTGHIQGEVGEHLVHLEHKNTVSSGLLIGYSYEYIDLLIIC